MDTQTERRPVAELAKRLAARKPLPVAGADAFVARRVQARKARMFANLAVAGRAIPDHLVPLIADILAADLWSYETGLRVRLETIEPLIAAWKDPDVMRRVLQDVMSGQDPDRNDESARAVADATVAYMEASAEADARRLRGTGYERHTIAGWPDSRSTCGLAAMTRPTAHHGTRSPRPRERRDGSRRHSTRGSTDDDSGGEPEPPGRERTGRPCTCGCGRDISHKRAGALTFDASCRKRLSRARQILEDSEFVPVRRAGLKHATGRRCESESCRCLLSRYGGGGSLCWTCAFASTANAGDPPLDVALVGLTRSDPLAEVLIAIGAYPTSSPQTRSQVIALAARLNVPLSDTQAGRLIEGFGGREGACDALAGMVRAKRRQLELVADELPELYSFAEHKTCHGQVSPDAQMAAYLLLPDWRRGQAWSTRRAEIDRECDRLVIAA